MDAQCSSATWRGRSRSLALPQTSEEHLLWERHRAEPPQGPACKKCLVQSKKRPPAPQSHIKCHRAREASEVTVDYIRQPEKAPEQTEPETVAAPSRMPTMCQAHYSPHTLSPSTPQNPEGSFD